MKALTLALLLMPLNLFADIYCSSSDNEQLNIILESSGQWNAKVELTLADNSSQELLGSYQATVHLTSYYGRVDLENGGTINLWTDYAAEMHASTRLPNYRTMNLRCEY